MTYKIMTLGCKVNQYETQALETMLLSAGFTPAEDGQPAELIVVNTCAVTAESGRKSRQAIRRMQGENPGAVTAVCGCFSQLSPEAAEALGVDVIHGSGNKKLFFEDILKAVESREKSVYTDDPFQRRQLEELTSGAVSGRTRAMLKIQDGCVNFCTYCIIPYTRGRLRSLPLDRCAAVSAELAGEGYRELVLTGIEIASYGKDLEGEPTLADAVEAVAAASGDMRIRLGSLEPTVITEDFCRRIAATGRVCPHFHLSMQSGCDRTLKAMNRKYDSARFFAVTERLRRYFPNCGLTADMIVGFPGETEKDHAEALAFIRKCGFSSMHIFPYSRRPGTKADKMPGQLTAAEKKLRAESAQAAAAEMESEFLRSCIGTVQPVLFEARHGDLWVGHAPNYALVCAEGENLHGIVENVKILSSNDTMLVGKVV